MRGVTDRSALLLCGWVCLPTCVCHDVCPPCEHHVDMCVSCRDVCTSCVYCVYRVYIVYICVYTIMYIMQYNIMGHEDVYVEMFIEV